MSNHESSPDEAGIRESSAPAPAPTPAHVHASPPEDPPARTARPVAWQPLTFRGVAAFSRARLGHLLIVQTIVALTVAAALVWFLQRAWFPRILDAIRALPLSGTIENQLLKSPRQSHEPLAADGFLAVAINLQDAPSLGSASDVRVEFHRADISICSLLGCLSLRYPAGYVIQFNRPELESWWGAWRTSIVAAVVAGTLVFLFANWLALAAIYAVPVWLAGFFKDRDLSLLGSAKLAGAALLTPALFMAAAIVAYGLNAVDLLQLLLLWIAHVPLGWAYLYLSLARVPLVTDASPTPANPFSDPATQKKSGEKKQRPSNPFAG